MRSILFSEARELSRNRLHPSASCLPPPASRFLLSAFCLLFLALSSAAQAATHALILCGPGGEPTYDQLFSQWIGELSEQLTPSVDSITTLAPGRQVLPSRDNILSGLAKYQTLDSKDLFLLFLIGHGSYDQTRYRFNIPGPDISGEDLAEALAKIPAQVAVINGTASSGASLPVLSHKNRVVISATRSGRETNPPRFLGFFVEGLDGRADADKNGSISLLELYRYARKKTAEWYQSQNRLASEHAALDDSGEGQGTEDPVPGSADGALAASLMLVSPSQAQAPAASKAMLSKKKDLEAAIEKLRFRKSEMPEDDYQQQLEELVLELARVNRQIAEGRQ